MSEPTDSLRKLSLNDTDRSTSHMVVTTRSQGRAMARSDSNSTESSHSDRAHSAATHTPVPETIFSQDSDIEYNVSGLDETSKARASLGFSHRISHVVFGKRTNDAYSFQFSNPVVLTVGGRENPPVCNCGANDGGRACLHIYWLIDQILQCCDKDLLPAKPALQTDGSKVEGMPFSELLKSLGEEVIEKKRAEWILRPGRESFQDVEEEMNEMLSVFEPNGLLPSEFKDVDQRNGDLSYVYRKFSDEIAEYASDDQWLRHRLRQIITPDFRALTYFEKLQGKVRQTFRSLENFIRSGPTGSDPSFTIVKCAERLTEIVALVDEGYNERVAGKLGSKKAATEAAAALIDVLKGVSERNEDAYAQASWATPISNMPARDCNLFVRLIAEPEDRNRDFAIDVLKNIPPDATVLHQDSLNTVLYRLEENGAPTRYTAALKRIIPEKRKRAGTDISESNTPRRRRDRA